MGLDLTKQLTARAIAQGVDEARAGKVAAELAPLLAQIFTVDDELLRAVEPAIRFYAGTVGGTERPTTPDPGSA